MREIIERLNEHTQEMVEQNRRFEQEITESNNEITQLRKKLEDTRLEAMTDSLTGLYNRKFFDTAFSQATREATKSATPLSVLMLDIDHFKKFNDTHGHPVGDQVLKLVAKTLVDSIKGRDLAGRYGGEEFLIVLPSTALANAVTLANQIRIAIGSRTLVNRNTREKIGRITVSIGVAAQHPGEREDTLIERADKALYIAKNNGRDQVIGEGTGRPKLIVRA